MGDLQFFEKKVPEKLRTMVASAQKKFDFQYDVEAEIERYREYSKILDHMILDGVAFINDAYNGGKRILVEGANAAMLDLDLGTYPYVTSSTPTIGGVLKGLGLSANKIGDVIGVVKAYTTRVGSGPFPSELLDETGNKIREIGREYGTTTGRPRRCGWLDIVVMKYSHTLNGYTHLNLTKLDVLSGLDEVRIVVAYKYKGKELLSVPPQLEVLEEVEVVSESFPGWKEDIAKIRKFEDLPENARRYIERCEHLIGVRFNWIGVGAARDDMIERF